MYDAIMFDLDGTLLPMDYDEFTSGYFKLLAKAAAPCGYDAQTLIGAMWSGVADMVKNDGTRTNFEVFWAKAAAVLGEKVYEDIPVFDAFYENDFNKAIAFTQPTPLAKKALDIAREKADKVILATNPIFPPGAVKARLSWAGLKYEDFDYVTDYSNSGTCKPNPQYFLEICEKTGALPGNCLMIGNNVQEDIEACTAAGFANAFLITDCLINEKEEMPHCPQGSFEDLITFLQKL